MSLPIQLSDDKQDFLKKQLESGISPKVISRAFQRRYNSVLRPQDIENFRHILIQPKKREDVEVIKAKLGSHDEQLEWARAKLKQRMDDESITNNDLVNLARELRSNITASQQIASMNDERGDTQFVLYYGDTLKKASDNADVTDAEFTLVSD